HWRPQRLGNRVHHQHGAHNATRIPAVDKAARQARSDLPQARREDLMADMLAAGPGFIWRGIPVFPVSAKTKKPTTRNGFKDATTDEAQVRSWWTNGPGNMIGIPMGPRSGMWLVDADIDPAKGLDGPKELAQLTAQYGPLPE